MRILVVDDDRVNSTLLKTLLLKDQHEVAVAGDGHESVQMFQNGTFDLVLMDVMMPGMNGYDAARIIKAFSADHFTPIIFLTAITDSEGLAKCVEVGGDDFLTKPFNRVILRSKIEAMERIRRLHSTLIKQKKTLEIHQMAVQQDLEMGQYLFDRIIRDGNLLDAPCLRHWTEPMSTFNGDTLMASYNPAGGLNVMLGDFTGHGLSAAVGVMPISDIFYSMSIKGFSIGDIVAEMNSKLCEVTPANVFCAASIITVDHRQKSLSIWNGGLPDILLLDTSNRVLKRILSSQMPLGVHPFTQEDRRVEVIEMDDAYRLFLYSDGIIEATNSDNVMYGQERLEKLLSGDLPPEDLFEAIQTDLNTFRSGALPSDDTSLLEIICSEAHKDPYSVDQHHRQEVIPPSQWHIFFDFDYTTLRVVDPLPTVIQSLMSLQAPIGHREQIHTVLAELYANALDHGLLHLDTQMKKTPEGFIRFYAERERRLASLKEGSIHIKLTHTPLNDNNGKRGGEFRIRVEDSGEGFNPDKISSNLDNNLGYGGRGIALMRSFCSEVIFHGKGNIAEVVYQWHL